MAIIRFRGESHVLGVDLGECDGAVTPLLVLAFGYPIMSMDEQTSLTFAPFKDAAFNASLRRRGVRASMSPTAALASPSTPLRTPTTGTDTQRLHHAPQRELRSGHSA
uniref:Uncharacterized protein n=1 Tax=Oryza rufipogon TaxID=4529 RepID=A0A0E0ND90_ORYRU